jgi:hypothetical protein
VGLTAAKAVCQDFGDFAYGVTQYRDAGFRLLDVLCWSWQWDDAGHVPPKLRKAHEDAILDAFARPLTTPQQAQQSAEQWCRISSLVPTTPTPDALGGGRTGQTPERLTQPLPGALPWPGDTASRQGNQEPICQGHGIFALKAAEARDAGNTLQQTLIMTRVYEAQHMLIIKEVRDMHDEVILAVYTWPAITPRQFQQSAEQWCLADPRMPHGPAPVAPPQGRTR